VLQGALAGSLVPPARAVGAQEVDVLVVGAGLAGLYAAMTLEESGAKVQVIEGRDRVGGRVYTLYDIPGRPEAGGEVFGAFYGRCLDVAKRVGLNLVAPRPRSSSSDADTMMNIRGENILLSEWEHHPFNPHPPALRKVTPWQLFFKEFPKLNPLKNLDDWHDPQFSKWDIPFRDFLLAHGYSDEAVRLQQANTAYGNTLYDVSALHLFHYFLWATLQDSGGKRSQIEGGNGRLPERMAERIKGDLRLRTPVRGFRTDDSGAEVVTADGHTIRARKVICTIPFSLLRFLPFDPPLEGPQREAVATLPYYKTYQLHYAIEKRYWEQDGLPPSIWSDAPFDRLNLLREVDSDAPACVLVYVNGLEAANLDRMAPADADAFIRGELARARPSLKGALRAIRVHSNQNDPFIGGSYAYWAPGMPARLPGLLAKPHGHIHFAGEHTALTNRGMEGAMESGERVAIEVLNSL
jgi:monoamine oxidase